MPNALSQVSRLFQLKMNRKRRRLQSVFNSREILAALLRSRAKIEDETLKDCFTPVLKRCRELLDELVDAHPELGEGAFRVYRDRFVGDVP